MQSFITYGLHKDPQYVVAEEEESESKFSN